MWLNLGGKRYREIRVKWSSSFCNIWSSSRSGARAFFIKTRTVSYVIQNGKYVLFCLLSFLGMYALTAHHLDTLDAPRPSDFLAAQTSCDYRNKNFLINLHQTFDQNFKCIEKRRERDNNDETVAAQEKICGPTACQTHAGTCEHNTWEVLSIVLGWLILISLSSN